jgi:hypothetical protein
MIEEYKTMTPGGVFGATLVAVDDEDAMELARSLGYVPVEVIDHGEDLVVVVEG